jgi:hypothetical protein
VVVNSDELDRLIGFPLVTVGELLFDRWGHCSFGQRESGAGRVYLEYGVGGEGSVDLANPELGIPTASAHRYGRWIESGVFLSRDHLTIVAQRLPFPQAGPRLRGSP